MAKFDFNKVVKAVEKCGGQVNDMYRYLKYEKNAFRVLREMNYSRNLNKLQSALLKFVKSYSTATLTPQLPIPETSTPDPPSRVSPHIYEETRKVLKGFLENVVWDTLAIAGEQRRSTVTPLDVIEALKLQGKQN